MNITPGPSIQRYAQLFGLDVDEVVDWVNAYVNHPDEFHCATEPTEKERFKSISNYIKWQIDETTDAHIRQRIALQKEKAA